MDFVDPYGQYSDSYTSNVWVDGPLIYMKKIFTD